RRILTTALAFSMLSLGGFGLTARADDGGWLHATSLVAPRPKYPADFKHFDYVNPDAPKGGLVRFSVTGTFDSLNFVPPNATPPAGLGSSYDPLMVEPMAEVSTEYGSLAEGLKFPPDYSSVTYKLREGAKWHDGEPITADDVVFSFSALKDFNPSQAF